MSSFTVANGTYSLWLVENGVTIASTTGAAFSGSTILADSYFSSAYAVTVAGTPVYLSSMIAGLTCNGNAVVLPSSPTNYQQLKLANLSTTTGCSVSGNGNNIMYQAANVSPATLPAKYVAEVIFVQNYDYAGHNAWIVTHIGT